jgi:hypothetical protein
MKNGVKSYQLLTQPALAVFASSVVNLMTTDAQFSGLSEDVKELKKRSDAYNLALSDTVNGGRIATITKNNCLKDLLDQLGIIINMVDVLANGDESIILAAGFQVRKANNPITSLDVPNVLKVENEKATGIINIVLEKVLGAVLYGIEKRILVEGQPDGEWTNGDYISSCKTKLSGFEPATKYEIRFRAIGIKGMISGWSTSTSVWVS